MVHNSSGSQWVIGNDLWFTTALAPNGLLAMLYGSQQLWLSMGYWSCNMVHKISGSQWVIGNVILFTKDLALKGLLVTLSGPQQLWLSMV